MIEDGSGSKAATGPFATLLLCFASGSTMGLCCTHDHSNAVVLIAGAYGSGINPGTGAVGGCPSYGSWSGSWS